MEIRYNLLMVNFDVARDWVILLPPDAAHVKKAAEDLSRYIGLLAGLNKGRSSKQTIPGPAITDASGPVSSGAVIVLNNEGESPESGCSRAAGRGSHPVRNGFSWRARPERVEIYGESGRGLCNGIYSFLAALGISWPAPGQETLPLPPAKDPVGSVPSPSLNFPLTVDHSNEPSRFEGSNSAAAPWRRFVPAGKETVNRILKKSEAFAAWAARRRYDALIFPLTAFASGNTGRKLRELGKFAGEYDIVLEAGGRDLSSLVPRKYFFFHRDFFRMVEGKRVKAHHFCPTNPGTIRLIGSEGGRLFRAAQEIKIFHLWPDKGEEATWCSCPTCRAFTPAEQNRIGVNTAADILAALNPGAFITYFEKSEEGGNIPLRKNLFRMEKLPEEKEFHN